MQKGSVLSHPVSSGSSCVDAVYQYDALTRRIVTETAAETRHIYFNSQWRAIEERVSGAVKAQYVWNPSDRWDLIRRRRSTTGTPDEIRFVLRDYLDPAAIINESGTVTERYRYDAFGPVTVLAPDFSVRTTSECGWNFLYHAEFIDSLTGLYNYGYRYYHPGLGRWISRDPIGERGGGNLYGFVGNSGIARVDILGRQFPGPGAHLPPNLPVPIGPTAPAYDEDRINSDNYDIQDYKYNTNRVEAGFCGCDPQAVDTAVSRALQEFSYFDSPDAKVTVHGDIASFNPTGFMGIPGIANDWVGGIGGIGNQHNVTLLGPGARHDQAAITNEGHGLIGMRIWRHTVKAGENNCERPHKLSLITEAFETSNNWGGAWGGELLINMTAKTMWTDYLLDTALGVLKDAGCRICFSRETLKLYPDTIFRQKNPFLDLAPKR